MRKLGLLVGMLCLVSLSAAAQKVDVFVGYSYLNFQPGDGAGSTNFNGGVGSVGLHITKMFSVVGEVSGYHASPGGIDENAITYMGGPKVSVKIGPFIPFGQALFGGVHTSGAGASNDNFAAAWGGGLDLKVSHHFAIRVAQVEDLYTRINGLPNNSQNSFRYSGGVVFKL